MEKSKRSCFPLIAVMGRDSRIAALNDLVWFPFQQKSTYDRCFRNDLVYSSLYAKISFRSKKVRSESGTVKTVYGTDPSLNFRGNGGCGVYGQIPAFRVTADKKRPIVDGGSSFKIGPCIFLCRDDVMNAHFQILLPGYQCIICSAEGDKAGSIRQKNG